MFIVHTCVCDYQAKWAFSINYSKYRMEYMYGEWMQKILNDIGCKLYYFNSYGFVLICIIQMSIAYYNLYPAILFL